MEIHYTKVGRVLFILLYLRISKLSTYFKVIYVFQCYLRISKSFKHIDAYSTYCAFASRKLGNHLEGVENEDVLHYICGAPSKIFSCNYTISYIVMIKFLLMYWAVYCFTCESTWSTYEWLEWRLFCLSIHLLNRIIVELCCLKCLIQVEIPIHL